MTHSSKFRFLLSAAGVTGAFAMLCAVCAMTDDWNALVTGLVASLFVVLRGRCDSAVTKKSQSN